MSSPQFAAVPAAYPNGVANLIAADGTAAKVLVDVQPAAVASATSPLYYGGGTVLDMTAVSTDAASKDVVVWLGQVLTTVGGSTGAATTTTGTIVRTTGDFVADGWKVGELVMLFNAAASARQATDGVLGIITAVAALTLTVNGTPFSVLTLTTGCRICRMSNGFRATVAAGSGSNGTLPSASLLNNGSDGSALRTERKFGVNELVAVSAVSAVSALPAYINVAAQFARY